VLATLNRAFLAANVDWDVSVTRPQVPVQDIIAPALEKGIDALAVYGGDGTVVEVAAALVGHDVPLAVLPGGTSNALAVSLGIPLALSKSVGLLVGTEEARVRCVDLGEANGGCFLVAVGVGIPGAWAASTAREQKLRFGTLAYLANALQALVKAQPSRYSLMLDGTEVVSSGVTCIIANSGSFGLPGMNLAPTIHMDDGLLDVIIIRDTDVTSIVSLAATALQRDEAAAPRPRRTTDGIEFDDGPSRRAALATPLQYWQAREIYLAADPPQAAQADGEVLPDGPIIATVVPRAVRIVVPAPRQSRAAPLLDWDA